MAGEIAVFGEGRVGNDPEMKTLSSGKTVTSFSLANTPRFQKDGVWVDGETIWFRCNIWGKNAIGASNELRKGALITFGGYLSQNTYTNKEGVERVSLEVTINGYGIVPKNNPEAITQDLSNDPWA